MPTAPRPDDFPQLPADLNAGQFETSAQHGLRQEFDELRIRNAEVLADFDPTQQGAVRGIELDTIFPGAEQEERALSGMLRFQMVRDSGIPLEPLEPGDPNRMFQYTWRDGEITQIRLVERPGKDPVPAVIEMGRVADGRPVERVTLVSNDEAARLADRLDAIIDEGRLDQRLLDEFGLSHEALEQAGFSFEDKQAMLKAHDEIQSLEVALPDLAPLNGVRGRLVRALTPRTDSMWSSYGRERKVEDATRDYEQVLSTFLGGVGPDWRTARKLIEQEQLLRLEHLNKRLQDRVKLAKRGAIGLATFYLSGGGALGGMAGLFAEPSITGETTTKGPVIGALVGLAMATPMIIESVNGIKKGASFAERGFRQDVDVSRYDVAEQIQRERFWAWQYYKRLRFTG